jgi:hypothetical protein
MTTPTTTTGSKEPLRWDELNGDYTLPDGKRVTWVALVRMLLELKPARCPDVATVAAVFGDAKFKTLGEVAQAFDRNPSVVRGDWRSAGMPGDRTTGWPVGELFRWHLNRAEQRLN